jgi:hypothetical protein
MLTRPLDSFKLRLREVEQELAAMFPLNEEDIKQDFFEKGKAIKERYASAKDRCNSVRLDLHNEFKCCRSVVEQDLRDFAATGRQLSGRTSERHQSSSGSTTQTSSALELDLVEQIRSFENYLRSDSFVPAINASIQNQLSSAGDMIAYYESRPELKEFTLTKELRRMHYTLYTPTGDKITDPDQIVNYEMENRGQETSQDHELLWRAANQSLFGDVICCLTSATGLIRPQLACGSFVNDCSVVIDLSHDSPFVHAECYVNVSIPSEDGERLAMAGVVISVYFCPTVGKELKAAVLYVSPSPRLTEEQVHGAAKSLAR